MQIAKLIHRHKHGVDVYLALVGDKASSRDEDEIVTQMIEKHNIDYDPNEGPDGEEMELVLHPLSGIVSVAVGYGEERSASKV